MVKRYKIGPLYTPPAFSNADGPLAHDCSCRPISAARTGPARHSIRKRTASIIHSHTAAYLAGIVPANPATSDIGYVAGQARAGGAGARGAAAPAADPDAPPAGVRAARGAAAACGWRGGTSVQGLPLIKPPYDRITAYDMKTGDIIWQKTHSSTPDDIKNHPALQGAELCRVSASPAARSSARSRRRRW